MCSSPTHRWREPDSNHRSRKATGLLGIIPINLRDRFFLYGKMRLDRQLRPAVRIPFAPPTSPSQQGPAVIGLAAERFTKNLWTDRNSGARPQLVSVRDEADQARCIVERVLENRESGSKLKQQ